MKRSLIIAAAVVVSSSAMAQQDPHCAAHAKQSAGSAASQPYAGEETRVVKSLSANDANALRSGAGMGLAKAAELNHYPGPKHVMEHSADLGMSEQQLAETKRAFDAMKDDAVRLGAEIVEKEEALDRIFASGTASEEAVAKATAEIASLQGRLRATHLKAHLRMREIMTPEQIAAYDTLRGYQN
ncbi:MAG: Spy/CpxP family protein refolding chaperone [Thermoanaerobaculia bacterium]